MRNIFNNSFVVVAMAKQKAKTKRKRKATKKVVEAKPIRGRPQSFVGK